MALTFTRDLEPLTSSGLSRGPSRDLRGRDVVDRDGETVGTVADMLIDPNRVSPASWCSTGGGLLGMGKKQYLVPLEAIHDDGSQAAGTAARSKITASRIPPGRWRGEELQYGIYTAYGIPYWEVEAAAPAPPRWSRSLARPTFAPAMELRSELHQRARTSAPRPRATPGPVPLSRR